MKLFRVIGFLSVFLLGISCVSPRLGFPVEKMQTPVEVSLFSTMTSKGIVDFKVGSLEAETWKMIYLSRFSEEVLGKVDVFFHALKLRQALQDNAQKAAVIFTPRSTELLEFDLQFSKKPEDPKSYSGFDFSAVKESIPTRYILALTIDEWGFTYARIKEDSGAYLMIVLRLIDKEDNSSVWEYREKFVEPILSPLRDTDSNSLVAKDFDEAFAKMIPKFVQRYFNALAAK